jgi:hypothetical protein
LTYVHTYIHTNKKPVLIFSSEGENIFKESDSLLQKKHLDSSVPSFCRRDQGCQIFLNTIYQNGQKYAKLPLYYHLIFGLQIYHLATLDEIGDVGYDDIENVLRWSVRKTFPENN